MIEQTEKPTKREIIEGLKTKYTKFLFSLTVEELKLFTYNLPDFRIIKEL